MHVIKNRAVSCHILSDWCVQKHGRRVPSACFFFVVLHLGQYWVDSLAARRDTRADFHSLRPRGEKSKPVHADFLFLIVQENENVVHCLVVNGQSLAFSSWLRWTTVQTRRVTTSTLWRTSRTVGLKSPSLLLYKCLIKNEATEPWNKQLRLGTMLLEWPPAHARDNKIPIPSHFTVSTWLYMKCLFEDLIAASDSG